MVGIITPISNVAAFGTKKVRVVVDVWFLKKSTLRQIYVEEKGKKEKGVHHFLWVYIFPNLTGTLSKTEDYLIGRSREGAQTPAFIGGSWKFNLSEPFEEQYRAQLN